jgi:hypothetical protein
MATTWETITVRVQRPHEASLGDFFSVLRAWLDHHCIILADFRSVILPGKSGVFDVVFDNPRDAALFERRFAGQPAIAATTVMDQSRASTLAAIASDMRRVLWTWVKVAPEAQSAVLRELARPGVAR